MENLKPIVFTVFEPSGDVLAARLIEEIKLRQPNRPVVAFGGPKMEAAGAEILEHTTAHAKMGFGAASEAKVLLRRKAVLTNWLKDNEIAALVPTDSPAANWSMCKAVRKTHPEAPIVHLVCPQIWAWATWRIVRLRKLTDHVMCLLPFEPGWLGQRGVNSTFVGHPLFESTDNTPDEQDILDLNGEPMRDSQTKLALLPGSRPKEIERNWPTMLQVYDQMRHRVPDLSVVIAAADAARAEQIRKLCPGGRVPSGIQSVVGEASAALDWADATLVVSGTATLQAASRQTPMVALYNGNMKLWHTVGKLLIKARTFALPNVITEAMELGRIVPEFIPHDSSPEPLATALTPLLTDANARQKQIDGFASLSGFFSDVEFRHAAADVLLEQIQDGSEF
ncbi:MAG: lipid-A-disaccharide synthase [Planctomycetota bacterium]